MKRSPEGIDMDTSHEFETKTAVTYLGTLEHFKLGNKDGIPSELADKNDEQRREYGEKLTQTLREVTDKEHYGCIDGRCTVCNADGSAPEIRLRQVGGTEIAVEVALDSGAAVLDTIKGKDIPAVVNGVESHYEELTGVKRSSHLGGCGGANGAVEDQKNIASNPIIMDVTEAFMAIPQVRECTEIDFDQTAAQDVRRRAGQTAEWMQANKWDGPTYVAGVKKDEPAGVEDLEVDTDDHKFHGHKEPAVVIIINKGDKQYSLSDEAMKELGVTPPFVMHVNASVEMAKALGGPQGKAGVTRALIANFAKHFSVCDRLPSPEAPVYLMVTE